MDKHKKYEKYERYLKKFAKKQVFCGWIMIIITAFCLDICKEPYCCVALEKLFSYQLGNLVAVIVVIWTATLSVCIYLWGKLDEQYFGIRIEEILLVARKEKVISRSVGFYIGIGLIVLIAATIGEMPILLFADAVLQIFTMVWIALFTAIYITRESVFGQVIKEIMKKTKDKNGKDQDWDSADEKRMLFTFLHNYLFSDECSYERVLVILINGIPKEERGNENSGYLYKRMNHIVHFILMRLNNSTKGKINELLMNLYQNVKLKAVKWGILSALMDQGTPWAVKLCINLIVAEQEAKMVYQAALFILMRNLYVEDIKKQRWRKEYTRMIKGKFWLKISSDDQKEMVRLLKEMYEDKFPGKALDHSDDEHQYGPVYKLLFHDVFEI